MVQTFAKPRYYAMAGIVLSRAIIAVGANGNPVFAGPRYKSSLPSYVAIAAILATVMIATARLVAYG